MYSLFPFTSSKDKNSLPSLKRNWPFLEIHFTWCMLRRFIQLPIVLMLDCALLPLGRAPAWGYKCPGSWVWIPLPSTDYLALVSQLFSDLPINRDLYLSEITLAILSFNIFYQWLPAVVHYPFVEQPIKNWNGWAVTSLQWFVVECFYWNFCYIENPHKYWSAIHSMTVVVRFIKISYDVQWI